MINHFLFIAIVCLLVSRLHHRLIHNLSPCTIWCIISSYILSIRCGPCRQFTPDLVNFYDKMNARRGKQNEFEIVWISRCRSVDDFGQYFTHMNWLALPPQEAMVSD